MPVRPTAAWRRDVEEQAAQIASGTLERHEAWALSLFPESLIISTDAALDDFDQTLMQVDRKDDSAVLDAVKQVVLSLNRINEDHNGAGYETDEREQLCSYIDEALTCGGVDVGALAARHGRRRWEITGPWRDW